MKKIFTLYLDESLYYKLKEKNVNVSALAQKAINEAIEKLKKGEFVYKKKRNKMISIYVENVDKLKYWDVKLSDIVRDYLKSHLNEKVIPDGKEE